jgi:pSer/pThr/pTyr-binding forkhead associated (FHA) protein
MPAYLEVWRPSGPELVPLEGERVTIGRSADNDVVLAHDAAASRLHAVLEHVGSRWCIRDLGSSNGTFVAGSRVTGERALQGNDELRIGSTRLRLRADADSERVPATVVAEKAPELTRREREVLVALCRTMVGHAAFREPASIRQMAAELFVTEAAVKQHLVRLYDKFSITEGGERRRVRLANEAIRRGAVNVAELRDGTAPAP